MKKINIVIIIGLIVVITLIIIFSFKSAPIIVESEPEITTTTALMAEGFPEETIPDLEGTATTLGQE
jgi:uncharacterized alpha/beta hydrolase family protein